MRTAIFKSTSLPKESQKTLGCDAESRVDPISGHSVIFATQRGDRPFDFSVRHSSSPDPNGCPFCVGREHTTPPAVWSGHLGQHEPLSETLITSESAVADELPVTNDWSVRVVPNKFPAVTRPRTGGQGQTPHDESNHGLFRSSVVDGGHEVIIESPDHVRSISELGFAQCALVFTAFQARLKHWRQEPNIQYISIFKNVGAEAGASLEHGHSQLIATSELPDEIAMKNGRLARYHAEHGCCLQCDLIRAELKHKVRIVAHSDDIVAYCPFASDMPMKLRITTATHTDQFESLNRTELEAVTRMTLRSVRLLEAVNPGVAYNVLLHTRPPGLTIDSAASHWSIDLVPRLTTIAGFELSSRFMINPVLPEVAADRYRSAAAAMAGNRFGFAT